MRASDVDIYFSVTVSWELTTSGLDEGIDLWKRCFSMGQCNLSVPQFLNNNPEAYICIILGLFSQLAGNLQNPFILCYVCHMASYLSSESRANLSVPD